jgi:hypothetical protein
LFYRHDLEKNELNLGPKANLPDFPDEIRRVSVLLHQPSTGRDSQKEKSPNQALYRNPFGTYRLVLCKMKKFPRF